jgi:hypothetical protein
MRGPIGPKGPYAKSETTEEEAPIHTLYGEVHPDYQNLPLCIKASVTAKEYLWMGDYSRSRLIKDMTEPEVTED